MNVFKLSILLGCTFLPSMLRVAVWRMLGFKVGRGCRISMFSVVVADSIQLDSGAVIEPLTFVYRPSVFFMGERARVASFVRIIGFCGKVTLGPQSFVALGCLIDSTGDFELGSRSQIGPRCTLYSHGATGLIFNMRYPHRNGKLAIGSDVWLGMGCIVHPQLTIGDRVLVLPGLVIRSNIPNDTSLIAPPGEHRSISTGRLLIGVTDEVRRQKMEGLLRLYAVRSNGAAIDETDAGVWRLMLPGDKTIYLLRTDEATANVKRILPERSVVWTLFDRGVVSGAPTFCFDQLTVFGPWTNFAEQTAKFLCSDGGAHFVFENNGSEQASPAGGAS